jgi:hypothetical protein
MTVIDREKILNTIKQVDAIFALEGFEPTDMKRNTDKAVLAGVGTYSESVAELVEYVKQNKTVDGFKYSKAIGL